MAGTAGRSGTRRAVVVRKERRVEGVVGGLGVGPTVKAVVVLSNRQVHKKKEGDNMVDDGSEVAG